MILFRRRLLGGRSLLPLSGAIHQLDDARLESAGAIGEKGEVRHVADAHPLLQLIADVALGSLQAMSGTALSTAT